MADHLVILTPVIQDNRKKELYCNEGWDLKVLSPFKQYGNSGIWDGSNI